jgi:FkbM family methyltransferase
VRPARLDLSLRNGAEAVQSALSVHTETPPLPEAPAEAEAAPATAPVETPPPAPRRRRGPVRLLLSPFKRYLLHARAFLLTPLEAPLDLLRHWLEDRIEPRLGVLEAQLAHTVQAGHQLQQAAIRLEAVADRLQASQREAIGEMWSSVGGRLDEIEVKLRPILPFGDDALAVRLGDGYVLAPTGQPVLLSMLADATTGGFEPGTRKTIQAILGPGMKAADIGANMGLLTMAMARAVGAAGKVWSFEPQDDFRSLLTRSLHLNGLSWVELRPEAAGAKAETRTFNVSSIPGHSSLFELPAEEKPRKVKVKVVRLDDIVPAGTALDLVKIDVEGAELEVLAGMERILDESPEIALIAEYGPSHLARVGIRPADWLRAFEAKGFETFAVNEGERRCYAVGLEHLEGVESVNLVFVRKGGRAVRRLPR